MDIAAMAAMVTAMETAIAAMDMGMVMERDTTGVTDVVLMITLPLFLLLCTAKLPPPTLLPLPIMLPSLLSTLLPTTL